MDRRALGVLKYYFGYDAFRPAQERPVMSLLNNEDILAIMPTGAGKSICFQIPALIKNGITLVFSPLISLMQDQVDGLRQQNIPAVYLNSTLPREERNKYLYYIRSGQVKLVYLAPERLGNQDFCDFLRELPISQVIIDEAHCVSQWGHDFRPSYTAIGPFIKSLPRRPVVGAFTASATEEVERDMKNLLGLGEANVHVTGFDRPNLEFSVVHVKERLSYILEYVRSRAREHGIIYCSTRKDVETVYRELVKMGVKAGYYHGGLPDEVRKEQQDWYAFDRVQVMVATNAFGMGIDKSNVRYVLHYQMPRNMEGYYQEAGRAGRDGGKAECILLYNGRDVMVHKYLISQSVDTEERRQVELERLQSMIDYCFTEQCLRKYMLEYFGERTKWHTCHNCSSCKGRATLRDMTEEGRAICKAIADTEERYGSSMIASVVCGDRTERILRSGFHRLSVFGILQRLDQKDVKSLIQHLISRGFLDSSGGKYPILSLTSKGYELLQGRGHIVEVREEVMSASRMSRAKNTSRGAQVHGTFQKESLFEALRKCRRQLAEEQRVPPYRILQDTVLIDMSQRQPTTLAELGEVKGIGDVKLQKYGLQFLKVIHEYKEEL